METALPAISGYIWDGAHVRTQNDSSFLIQRRPPLTASSQFPACDLAVCDISGCGRKLNEIAYFADKSGSNVTTLSESVVNSLEFGCKCKKTSCGMTFIPRFTHTHTHTQWLSFHYQVNNEGWNGDDLLSDLKETRTNSISWHRMAVK
jgi:hypothetical protein